MPASRRSSDFATSVFRGLLSFAAAVLGMHFCDPNQLIATKQRNKLAAANKALCYIYLTRGSFKEDQHTQASLTCVCLSLRLFVRTVWLDVETPETFFSPRA